MINHKEILDQGFEMFEDSYLFPEEDTELRWELSEADTGSTGVVDGMSILGRAVGPFFVVDGKSQNNRFYQRSLWERVIKEAQATIQKGAMLCTIGHGQPLDDSALLEGKVSHRISKLWIDENKKIGMGEMLILNTPAGRTLNTYLRSGCELPVSSRGYGKYSGTMEDGTRIVDSESYKLEGFDIVRVPGIPSAIPRLVEAKSTEEGIEEPMSARQGSTPPSLGIKNAIILSQNETEEDITLCPRPHVKERKAHMEETVLTKMTEEKIRLEENLRQALDTNSRLEETIKALKGQLDEFNTSLTSYRRLGAIEDISRVMDVTETMLHNRPVEESDFVAVREQLEIYEELGTPEELEALFDKFENFMNQYEDLGTPADLDQALNTSAALLEGYSDLGSPLDINEAFDSVEVFMGEMNTLGTVAELHAVCDLLEAYQEYGTPTELAHAFEMMNTLVSTTQSQHMKSEGKALATEYGIDPMIAESMIGAMGSARARDTLGAINESRTVTSRYLAPSARPNAKHETQGGNSLNEDVRPYSTMSATLFNATPTSRATRLFEKMSK